MPPFRDRFELKKDDTLYGMTLKGVFFLLGQYIYGGNCYFVNGPKLSQSILSYTKDRNQANAGDVYQFSFR